MGTFSGYQCSTCGQRYGPEEATYLCPLDGGNLDVLLDFDALKNSLRPQEIQSSADRSLWRYLPLLPVGDPGHLGTPLRSPGWTPIYRLDALAAELGLANLWLKDESLNPTASFKDRASALLVARAAEIGAPVIVTASTGNAGAALAGMAAAVGAQAVIFVPQSARPGKIAQLLIYGARVFLVEGTYDDAVRLSRQAAAEFGWYCRDTGYNPFTIEGKKTAAFEVWEQHLGQQADQELSMFIPVGDGNIISSFHKGFQQLQALGWLTRMPRLFGVQAEKSAAIANAFEGGGPIEPVNADTLADGISVDMPNDGPRALRAATETGGAYLKVSDAEILDAVAQLGRHGIFAEPAGAASLAGARKAIEAGAIKGDDPVMLINTGSGLKDIGAAMQAAGQAPVIEPSLAALKQALEVAP